MTESMIQERPAAGSETPEHPDLFISYSRKDEAFVRRLVQRLGEHKKEAWVDWEDIPPTADWMNEVAHGIDAAESLAFVISPDSLTSAVCARELEHALAQGKRIVPLLLRDNAGAPMPDALASRNWIAFRSSDDFDEAFAKLIRALESDLEWSRAHTRLLVRAVEWQERGRDGSRLLRGADLREAETWVARVGPTVEPQPTQLQREYLVLSRQAQTRRQRVAIAAVVLALLVTIFLAVLAWLQRNTAVSNERQARSRELAASAISQLPADPELSVLLAREGVRTRSTPQATTALRLALAQSHVERRLPTAGSAVDDVALSADGRLAVTAGSDRIARIWDFSSGRLLGSLPRQRNPCPYALGEGPPCDVITPALLAAFSPDAKLLATAGAAGDVRVWNWRNRRQVAQFRTVTSSLAFSQDGRFLLTAGTDLEAAARVWAWRAGEVRATLSEPSDVFGGQLLTAARFSPDGRLVVTASAAGNARIWNWSSRRTLVNLHHPAEIEDARFDPSGTFVVTACDDGVARVWRWRSGRVVATLRGHTDRIEAATFDRHGGLVLTAGADGTARVWDWRRQLEEAELRGHRGAVLAATFTPDGTRAVTAGVDGTTRIWTRLVQRSLVRLARPIPKDAVAYLGSAAISPDGKLVLTGGLEPGLPGATARLWDWRRRQTVAAYHEANANESGEGGPQLHAAFAPDGTRVVIASRYGGFVLWNPKTHARTRVAPPVVDATSLAADGRLAAVSDLFGRVSLVDTTTKEVVRQWEHVDRPLTDVALSPDGEELAAAGQGGLRVWRRTDRRVGTALAADTSTVAFSPDGRLVVAAGPVPRVWDWRRRRVLAELPSPGGAVTAEFSADGDLVVTADLDRTTRVWAWNAEQIVKELRPPASSSRAGIATPTAAALSKDGSLLVVANSDGAAYVFACEVCRPISRLLSQTCAEVTRNLTLEEWQRYVGSGAYRKTCPHLDASGR